MTAMSLRSERAPKMQGAGTCAYHRELQPIDIKTRIPGEHGSHRHFMLLEKGRGLAHLLSPPSS